MQESGGRLPAAGFDGGDTVVFRASSPALPRYFHPIQQQKNGHTIVWPFHIAFVAGSSLLPKRLKHLHQNSGIEVGGCCKIQDKP